MIQGKVLGPLPLLFLLYANDVTDIFDGDCVCKLYADDIQLYSVIDNATTSSISSMNCSNGLTSGS